MWKKYEIRESSYESIAVFHIRNNIGFDSGGSGGGGAKWSDLCFEDREYKTIKNTGFRA